MSCYSRRLFSLARARRQFPIHPRLNAGCSLVEFRSFCCLLPKNQSVVLTGHETATLAKTVAPVGLTREKLIVLWRRHLPGLTVVRLMSDFGHGCIGTRPASGGA